MLGKRKTQASFMEALNPRRKRACQWLRELDQIVDWEPIEYRLEELYTAATGRPSHPPLVMFKALLLAQWYDLSDPELEEQLLDRRSFQEFCGIGETDSIPDETCFVRFRQLLLSKNMDRKLFRIINRVLEKKGMVLKRGTLVDATLIASAAKKPPRPKDGEPVETSDPEARWSARQGQQPVYGYKYHVGVDQKSQIIRKLKVTPANVSDSDCFDDLLSGDETAVFADKGYMHRGRIRFLRILGIHSGIMQKGFRKHPLRASQKRRNRLLAGIRGPVECIFGQAKRIYGCARTRYRGIRINELKGLLLAIAMNLKRSRALAYA